MWKVYRAEIWSFDERKDPKYLEKFNHFGCSIFVVRNTSSDDGDKGRVWFTALKDTISIDAGLKVFETVYNVGTCDVYLIGPGVSQKLKGFGKKIAKLQSVIDKLIDEDQTVLALKAAWENASRMTMQMVKLRVLTYHRLSRRLKERELWS